MKYGVISTGNREEHPMYKKCPRYCGVEQSVVGTVRSRAEHKKPKMYALQICVLFDTY
jgi:hypothetical protein